MTGLSNLALRELQANGNEVVRGGNDDKNLFKSKKKKMQSLEFRRVLELQKNLFP